MRTFAAVLAGLFVLAWGGVARAQVAERPRLGDGPAIVVAGRGVVQAEPDQVSIRLGATAQAEAASQAQDQVNQIVQDTIAKLKRLNLPEEKIRTVEVSLQPVYVERPQPPGVDPKEPRIVGYRATNLIQVQTEDLKLVGKIIDTAVAAGANRLDSISFELKDDTKARQRALQLAVQQAQEKAKAVASAMGVPLGGVLEAIEGGPDVAMPPVQYARAALAEAAVGGAPIQPGQLTVEAFVTIRYRIARDNQPGR